MKKAGLVVIVMLAVAAIGVTFRHRLVVHARPEAQNQGASSGPNLTPANLDRVLAPIALYPDQLLAQILLCAMDPAGVRALDQFLKSHQGLKGTELQDAALRDNFEPSFVAMALFPTTVEMMARMLDWTTELGQAFAKDKTAVFASIQRLRAQAREVGNLKTTPQQEVETRTTTSGEQVIVIEPANPQVVYVPQYNTTTVYTTAPTSTTVVVQNDNSADAAAAGIIGFTAGIAIGAAVNNNYYYGPYGWHGGAYMYNDAWNDYYDAREDAREDWQDHREDVLEERGDRRENVSEQRTERQENRQENRPESQAQRTERQQNRQENRPAQSGQRTQAQTASTTPRSSGYESRGYSQGQGQSRASAQDRSGTRSDAFSGYSSGQSTRAASSRGQSSRASGGGGGARRSGGGGGRRR